MAININNTAMDRVLVNNVDMHEVYVNNVLVWTFYGGKPWTSGETSFSQDGNLSISIINNGLYSINVYPAIDVTISSVSFDVSAVSAGSGYNRWWRIQVGKQFTGGDQADYYTRVEEQYTQNFSMSASPNAVYGPSNPLPIEGYIYASNGTSLTISNLRINGERVIFR